MSWTPRSPHDEADGLVWLPRLIDKARRSALGRASGADLMNGYLYGNSDYIDSKVLGFWASTIAPCPSSSMNAVTTTT